MPANALFCPRCGQRYLPKKQTVGQLFLDFFKETLNLESKTFRTLRDLLVPGKLTQAYFGGRQKSYLSPIRVFLIFAALHFAALSTLLDHLLEKKLNQIANTRRERAYFNLYSNRLDSVSWRVEKEFKPRYLVSKKILDTLRKRMANEKVRSKDSLRIGYIEWKKDKFSTRSLVLNEKDLVTEDSEVFLSQHKIADFWSRLQVRQGLKLLNNTGNFTQFLLAKFTWMILIMLIALALVLKLLYLRRKRYYVEHLVFAVHYHAFAFLIMAGVFLLPPFGMELEIASGLSFLIILIYLFWAIKRFYRQSFFKTFLKFMILNFAYLIIFTLALSVTVFVSIFLF
jgi:hypothetical protein